MNDLKIFENDEFGQVRALQRNDEIWFVGKDLTNVLGYQNGSRDINRHVDEEDKEITKINSKNQARKMTIINESGMYSLVLSSKMPKAKEFKRWVTSEVLPSIRKHGMYAKDELLDNPDLLIDVAQKLKEEREQRRKLEAQNEELKPKANKYDEFMNVNGLISVRSAAHILDISGVGQNKLFQILRDEKIFYKKGKQNKVYQKYLNRGYFKVKENPIEIGDKIVNYEKILFTPKGIDWIRDYLKENGYKKGV